MKVSRKTYGMIKRTLTTSTKNQAWVARQAHLSLTTVNRINTTKNYAEYLEKYAPSEAKKAFPENKSQLKLENVENEPKPKAPESKKSFLDRLKEFFT